jgi:hypothetical protein
MLHPHDRPTRRRRVRRQDKELEQIDRQFLLHGMDVARYPLPGSADHQALDRDGVWMDPDMNKYDLEHVTTGHPVMTSSDWQEVYRRAWDLYYSAEHIETIFRRAKASGIKPVRLVNHILQFYFTFLQENVHPLQGGYFRRKLRRERRAGPPRENPAVFYPRRVREVLRTHIRLAAFYLLCTASVAVEYFPVPAREGHSRRPRLIGTSWRIKLCQASSAGDKYRKF